VPRLPADPQPVQLVFDFDSTVVALEGLDELARIALADDPERERKVEAIEAITRDGMSGSIGIDESLRRRLAMLSIERRHVDAVVKLLKRRLSPSFRRHIAAVRRNADRIHVVSSGFREYVEPVCRELGIAPSTVRDYLNDPFRAKARKRQRTYAVDGVTMPAGGTPIKAVTPSAKFTPHKGKGVAHNLARGRQMRAIIGWGARRG
jgi:hypothetical protein